MRWKRSALISLVLLLLVVGACGLWFHAQQKQYALNRRLIDALVHNNDKQALALVNEGADPNTHYKPTPPPSLLELVKQVLHRSPPLANDSPTAFLIVCGAHFNDDDAFNDLSDATLVQAMLKHGANVNAKDKDGLTALMDAIASENTPDVVRLLLERGADINAKSDDGRTPLMVTIEYHASPDVARLLLEHGADVDAKDYGGRTSLIYAAAYPSPDVIRLLIEHKADVNAKNNVGTTPLMFAAMPTAAPEVIRQLLKHGADVNAKDNDGQTPLMLAQGHPDIIALLKHAGAKK